MSHIPEFLQACEARLQKQQLQLEPAIRNLLIMEQLLLNRGRDPKKIQSDDVSNLSKKFAPESGNVFELRGYWISREIVHHWQAAPSIAGHSALVGAVDGNASEVLLLIHPASFQHYSHFLKHARHHLRPAEEFKVLGTPTSSARTLLAWFVHAPQRPFLIKLSLAAWVGGVDRTIRNARVPKCIGITALLDGAAEDLPSSFCFQGERYGIAPRGMARGGMLVRDLPAELGGVQNCVPLFSLFATPPVGKKTLLSMLVDESGQSVREYIRTHISAPFAGQWAALTVHCGIVTEPHAQNLQIEFDESWRPTGRFIHRDLEDVNVDIAYRQRRQLPVPKLLPFLTTIHTDYTQFDHRKWIRMSVNNFFEGGVLHPLELAMRHASANHYDTATIEKPGVLADDFREELASALARYSCGTSRRPKLDYANLDQYIGRLRAAYV